VDEAHETLSGPATKRILEREFTQYKHAEYERLATISGAHIYNLRQRPRYRERRLNYTKTRAVQVAIGERRKPRPDGKPGYLRVDTVHRGDLDGVKGVYRINLVDEVTQGQMVACVAAIAQSHLKPVLQDILDRFPFVIRGFHSDNGSEFINDMVSGLLRDLLIEQTKSRARKSNDNGLVESKNGAVIRKHMGYGYIAAEHAEDIHAFYPSAFNPYLNFHRPCGQPERIVDQRGKEKFVYQRYARRGKRYEPWSRLCRQARATSSPPSASRAWIASPKPTATPKPPAACRKPSVNCFWAFARNENPQEAQPAWGEHAVEMPGRGKRGKPKSGFPPFPPALGNRSAIPTFPPRLPLLVLLQNQRKEPSYPLSLRSPLQARSSIRKCSVTMPFFSSLGRVSLLWELVLRDARLKPGEVICLDCFSQS
jgi:transposase InsO family protein